LDNGRILVLWLGHNIPQAFLKQVHSTRVMNRELEGMGSSWGYRNIISSREMSL